MTVLITGAGLIATHSAVSLIDRGEDVVFYDVAPNQAYIDLVLEGRNNIPDIFDIQASLRP